VSINRLHYTALGQYVLLPYTTLFVASVPRSGWAI